jgi:hypothetical protein
VAQPEDTDALQNSHAPRKGDHTSWPEAPGTTSLQQSADTAPLITQSITAEDVEPTESEEPQYLRRRFSDLRGAQDILEV